MVLRDVPVLTLDGRNVSLSDFRGSRNIVLLFAGGEADLLLTDLRRRTDELRAEEAIVLLAPDSARELYDAPASAVFLADRYGEIFFSARHPEPLPVAAEVLKWLEFINAQCPE